MSNTIKWETSLEEAISRARTENKPVFLDFHNPQ